MADSAQKDKNRSDSKLELLIAGFVLVFLIKFLIPIAFGFILAALFTIAVGKTRPINKAQKLGIFFANWALLTYLAVGLPFQTGNKLQYVGFLGSLGNGIVLKVIHEWNSYWSTSNHIIKNIFSYQYHAWQDIAIKFWCGLGLAALFLTLFLAFTFFKGENKNGKPKKRFQFSDELSQKSNFLTIVLGFPLYQIIRFISFKPAARAHNYALSLRNGNFWFVRKMIIEGLIFFILSISYFTGTPAFNDLTQFFALALATPFFSFVGSFIVGLVPVAGDFINGFIFESPFGHLDLNRLNPLHGTKSVKGFSLGRDEGGRSYVLTEKNINHHIQIVAPSGGGKTNIIKNFLHDRIQKGHGVIFLDYKADFEVAEFLQRVANQVKRENEVRIFSLSNREISIPYNPLSHGTAAELQSRLINAFNWSEIYYKSKAESALLKLFRGLAELRDLKGNVITIKTVYDTLSKKGRARELSIELKSAGGYQWEPLEELASLLDRPTETKDLLGLITNLEKVIYSGAGELLTIDAASRNTFTIEEAIEQGLITYFLMNSLSSKETATSVGKLLLQDLMGFVGRAYDKGASNQKPITIVIDEFAEFAIPDFPSFLNRVRGAGIGVVIAHQTRGDLKAVSEDYQIKIEANTNTKIIAGVTDPEDADYYAALIGTQTVQKFTEQVAEDSFLFFKSSYKTGMGSMREVSEYKIHPDEIKEITQGQALVITRTVDKGFGMVQIPRAPNFGNGSDSKEESMRKMKEIRGRYLLNTSSGLKTEIVAKTQKQTDLVNQNIWE